MLEDRLHRLQTCCTLAELFDGFDEGVDMGEVDRSLASTHPLTPAAKKQCCRITGRDARGGDDVIGWSIALWRKCS